jgi:hypothetical protein
MTATRQPPPHRSRMLRSVRPDPGAADHAWPDPEQPSDEAPPRPVAPAPPPPEDTGDEEGRATVVYSAPGARTPLTGPAGKVLAVAVVVLVVFALGAGFGRWTAGSRDRPGTPAAGAPADGAPAAGVPAEEEEPATGALPAAGPVRVQDGVPVGYAHTRDGAVAAATNYVAVLSSELVFDPSRRRAAVAALAAPQSADALQRSTERNAATLARSFKLPEGGANGTSVLLRAVPVGAKVDHYESGKAVVSIWQTSIGGSGNGVPVSQSWGVTTVTLAWSGEDWKQVSASSRLGPVPLADGAQPTAASELIAKTRDFKEYRYAPGS